MESAYFAVAFLGGLIPALFWLWFWLREDEHPEPYLLIALAFIGGMMVVPLALPLQKIAIDSYDNDTLIFVWVVIEETLKYAMALLMILWRRVVDEPIDVIIYMIAIALGFAALENALFIFNPLTSGDYANSAITGSFRFLGSTLLHVPSEHFLHSLFIKAHSKNSSGERSGCSLLSYCTRSLTFL
jgi:RsiW-degrading membrane proteinase PrsW (M82 family)